MYRCCIVGFVGRSAGLRANVGGARACLRMGNGAGSTPSIAVRAAQSLGWGVSVQLRFCSSNNKAPPPKDGTPEIDNVNVSEATQQQPTSSTPGSKNGESEPDKVVAPGPKPSALSRVKRLPLLLVEEVPLPRKIMSDIELLMKAWCDEHAEQYRNMLLVIRFGIFLMVCILTYVFYQTILGSEKMLRGNKHVPRDLNVGTVVYFDISENDSYLGRVVIGLLTEKCPLYCEYFHRRCTGSGGDGDSFRGMTMSGMVPKHAAIFGEGRKMTHDLEGFNKSFLPTEYLASGPWRGCLSSICYSENKESPNFAIHLSSGDYPPQVFGVVLAGYDIVERMGHCGVSLGGQPKKAYRIEECGELCTLDKSNIVPLPWKLYNNISKGYDEERFGPRSDWSSYYPTTGIMGSEEFTAYMGAEGAATSTGRKKPWWKLW